MNLLTTPSNTKPLCELILDEAGAMGLALDASLQAGGGELKLGCAIRAALNKFMIVSGSSKAVWINEYGCGHNKRVDWALVDAESIGNLNLDVTTIIEAKFNYLSQSGIANTAVEALDQVRGYAQHLKKVNASGVQPDAHMLYLVARYQKPAPISTQGSPRSNCWRHHAKRSPGMHVVLGSIAGQRTNQKSSRVFNSWDLGCVLVKA